MIFYRNHGPDVSWPPPYVWSSHQPRLPLLHQHLQVWRNIWQEKVIFSAQITLFKNLTLLTFGPLPSLQDHRPHLRPARVTAPPPQLDQGEKLLKVKWVRLLNGYLFRMLTTISPWIIRNGTWCSTSGWMSGVERRSLLSYHLSICWNHFLQGEMVQRLAKRFKFPHGRKEVKLKIFHYVLFDF